ncbi:MAG: YicC family protein [Alphaproteobacteria bacterium]|nr:MAG: YicC family protein [Alphaproteobacteria bacterium]
MTIKSMTGFARAMVQWQGAAWQCEIKSVNGRNLDLRCRVPEGYDLLEPFLRQEVPKIIRRGTITLNISVLSGKSDNVDINEALLHRFMELQRKLKSNFEDVSMRFEQVLAIPGIVQSKPPADIPDNAAMELWQALILPTIQQLDGARRNEGQALSKIMTGQIEAIAKFTEQAEARLVPQADVMRARLIDQAANLTKGVNIDDQRLTQELALLVIKADVREELDRLKAHIQAAKELLGGEGNGRKFDFLCQEFNREANTLCSKSADIELTRIGLELKNTIDQLREQVQNIE